MFPRCSVYQIISKWKAELYIQPVILWIGNGIAFKESR